MLCAVEQAHAKFIVYAGACQDTAVRDLINEAEQPFLRCEGGPIGPDTHVCSQFKVRVMSALTLRP